jgi:biopolymer transport protein TolR
MSAAFSRRLRTRKLKSEINVVPYIDVMLVLLIIFMVTAPLLNLGVDVDLPDSQARAVQTKKDPVLVMVDATGQFSLKLPENNRKPVDAAQLVAELKSLVATNKDIAVLVAGDVLVGQYQRVMDAMALIQTAGVEKISLLSKPPEGQ